MIRNILVAVLLFSVAGCVPDVHNVTIGKAAPEGTFQVFDHKQVVYKKVGDVELKLHIFEPAERESEAVAAIVFFHGGGGCPKQFYPQAKYFAVRGMVAIPAAYRLNVEGGTSTDQLIKNGKSAIRWVRAHAKELGVDPKKIVASGGSAGGYVASSIGTLKGFEEEDEDLSVSSMPNAMVLFNPSVISSKQEFSPMHNIRKGLPPTIIFHGTDDEFIPVEHIERFCGLMNEAGNRCEFHLFDGEGHAFFNYHVHRHHEPIAEKLRLTDEFLCKLGYLKGKPFVIDEEYN